MESELRRLPSVDKVLSEEQTRQLEGEFPHELLVSVIRQELEYQRAEITSGKPCPSLAELLASVCVRLEQLQIPNPRPVINATGTILHTNLGRASLSPEAVAAMSAAAKGYSNLEFDIDRGARGSRQAHIEGVMCQLSGAEAAMVVNNNASAVLLGLTAVAKRKEVIVSRGQAVEIGDSFRIPDVMRQSGAKLVEVGTTNRTYLRDYEQAITPRTAVLMRVHSSNFRVIGFTSAVTLEEMVTLGDRYQLPVFDDLGSGCFLDTADFGLEPEPMVQQSVTAGAGLVFFSGDKLVGGPQTGIIVGKKQFIDRLKRHPMARAVRIDKIRLAALSATLIHYLKGEAIEKIPVWRMLATSLGDIEKRAAIWVKALDNKAVIIEGESMVGGGSLPGGVLPTKLVAVGSVGNKRNRSTVRMAAQKLRQRPVPVIGRISEDILLLDPRTVLPEDDDILLDALHDISSLL